MKGGAVSVSELTANVGGVFAGVSLSEGKLRVPQLVLNLDEQTILVDGVALSAKGKREADSFEAKLDAPKISITRDKAGGSDVILQIKAQGPRLDTSVSVKLSGVEGSGKAVRVGQLVVNVDAKQADNAVKGSLSTSILANLENRVIQLPKLAGDFAVASPDLPAKKARLSLSGNAGADLKKQSANVDLAMKAG